MAKRRRGKKNNSMWYANPFNWILIVALAIFLIRAYEGATDQPISSNPSINQLVDDIDPFNDIAWEGQ